MLINGNWYASMDGVFIIEQRSQHMRKAIIVTANTRWFGTKLSIAPMAALPILATVLKEGGWEYDIIDCNGQNYSEEECVLYIKNANPDVVLISGLTLFHGRHYERVAELAKIAMPDITTIIGGVYATLSYAHIMNNRAVDYAMLGHAEERLCEFLDAVLDKSDLSQIAGIAFRDNGEVVVNPVTSYVGDLSKMVKPDYSKIDLTPYIEKGYRYSTRVEREFPVITSYGCPHNCLFCAVRVINGKKVAFREVEDIIEEIRYLKETYHLDSILFSDDNLLTDENRAKRLFNRICIKC